MASTALRVPSIRIYEAMGATRVRIANQSVYKLVHSDGDTVRQWVHVSGPEIDVRFWPFVWVALDLFEGVE
jgi:hypothetical protein